MKVKHLIGHHVLATNANGKLLLRLGFTDDGGTPMDEIESDEDYEPGDVFNLWIMDNGNLLVDWTFSSYAEGDLKILPIPDFKLKASPSLETRH